MDFCSPDLNPCQHDAQCVGTPDGPRSVAPTARDFRLGSAFSPSLLFAPVRGFGLSCAGLLRFSAEGGYGYTLARETCLQHHPK